MGGLPRPLVPDGPLRELFDALHALHHEAGWPSLRIMAREVGCSHTTISAAFSEPKLPRWGLLELIVETLGGDPERFHRLWLAASAASKLSGSSALPDPADSATPSAAGMAGTATPQDLPADVSGFTGRTKELELLDRLLIGARRTSVVISAVSGTAGVGKTALALRWAHRAAERFPDGQLYINLRGYDADRPVQPSEALGVFLRELGVEDSAIPHDVAERAAKYRTVVAGRRILVLLDNAHSVSQVRDLLPGTSSCAVVITSRETLPALVARHGAVRVDLGLPTLTDAVDLLRTLVGARVDADPESAARLASMCARLPLAIRIAAELAVARPDVPLGELADEFADESRRLDLLAAGDDEDTAVRAVFSRSFRHLTPRAADTFRLLGLHPGRDFDVPAVAALLAVEPATVQRLLSELSRAHLLQAIGRDRYGMHDLLRAYAAELAGEVADADRRAALVGLCDHYASVVAGAERAWLDTERRNLLATARVGVRDHPAHTVRLAAALSGYLDSSAHFNDALELQGLALAAAKGSGDRAGEAAALDAMGQVVRRMGRYGEAMEHHRGAAAIYTELGDRPGLARALHGLGIVGWRSGRYEEARGHLNRALVLYREAGDHGGEGHVLHGLGVVYRRLGDYDLALEHYERSIEVNRRIGNRLGEARAVNNLAIIALRMGRVGEALDHHRHALAIDRELGDRVGEGVSLTNIGLVMEQMGRYDDALRSHHQALEIYREIGYRVGMGDAARGLGTVHTRLGAYERAHGHLEEALAIAREIGEADMEAGTLNDVGHLLYASGRPDEAADSYRAALEVATRTGDRDDQARALAGLARAMTDTAGSADPVDAAVLAEAQRHHDQARELYATLGLPDPDAR